VGIGGGSGAATATAVGERFNVEAVLRQAGLGRINMLPRCLGLLLLLPRCLGSLLLLLLLLLLPPPPPRCLGSLLLLPCYLGSLPLLLLLLLLPLLMLLCCCLCLAPALVRLVRGRSTIHARPLVGGPGSALATVRGGSPVYEPLLLLQVRNQVPPLVLELLKSASGLRLGAWGHRAGTGGDCRL